MKDWLKFYPAQWRGDVSIRLCSLAARGLWIDIIALADEGGSRAPLRVGGEPLTADSLARLSNRPIEEVEPALAELERNGLVTLGAARCVKPRRAPEF